MDLQQNFEPLRLLGSTSNNSFVSFEFKNSNWIVSVLHIPTFYLFFPLWIMGHHHSIPTNNLVCKGFKKNTLEKKQTLKNR